MSALTVAKKIIGSSYLLRKGALEVYERLPLSLRQRISFGPVFFEWLAFLRESDKWDKDRFHDYQLEQLRNLLRQSMNHVPYYRRLFSDYGFNPEKIRSLEDIKVLPYLSKETVRDRQHEFINERIPRRSLLKTPTSGSTGIPLTIYKTRETAGIFFAHILHSLNRVNYDPSARQVRFWNLIELGKDKNLPFLYYGKKLIFSNQYRTEKWLSRYAELMRRFDPGFIAGFPSSLSLLSSFIRSNNIPPPRNVKIIYLYAETLFDWQRRLMEEVFRARIFSVYAMTESTVFGSECEDHNRLHIFPQYGLTEFDPLESGLKEIVTTGFTGHAMPFIRYRTGDTAEKVEEQCPRCCRHHPLVAGLEGRVNDFLINGEGKVVPRLIPLVETFPNVRQWQFFQEEPGKASLSIVKAEKYSDADTPHIRRKIGEILGEMKDTMDIEIVFVDEIPKGPSRKAKLVDQRLDVRKFLTG